MCVLHWLKCVFCTASISIIIFQSNCWSQESSQTSQIIIPDKIRAIGTDDPLEKAYNESFNSIEVAEEFIKTYPQEKDLCAGMLLRIARLYKGKNEKKKAIEIYEKVINEYGNEIIPYVNMYMKAGDSAFLEIGLIEKEIGNRDKALEIFDKLSKSSNSNIRNNARIHYLATKQSHLKLKAKVTLPKNKYFKGEEIKGLIVIKNPEKEDATIQCFVRIRRKKFLTYGSIEQVGQKEITLKPGHEYKGTFVFDIKNRFEPEIWVIDSDLNGVPVESNTVTIKVVEKADSAGAMGLKISLVSICLLLVSGLSYKFFIFKTKLK